MFLYYSVTLLGTRHLHGDKCTYGIKLHASIQPQLTDAIKRTRRFCEIQFPSCCTYFPFHVTQCHDKSDGTRTILFSVSASYTLTVVSRALTSADVWATNATPTLDNEVSLFQQP